LIHQPGEQASDIVIESSQCLQIGCSLPPMEPSYTPQVFPLPDESKGIDAQLYAEAVKVNKLTRLLTWGLLASIIIPVGMLVVVYFAIPTLLRAKRVFGSAAGQLSLMTYCPRLSKAETKAMLKQNPILKALSDFAHARIALWIIVLLPFIYIPGIILLARLFW